MAPDTTRSAALRRAGNYRRLGQQASCATCYDAEIVHLQSATLCDRCCHEVTGRPLDSFATPNVKANKRCLRCRAPDGLGVVVLCAECRLTVQGLSAFQAHHPMGRANHPATVRLPANVHERFSEMQHDWNTHTLRNPDHDPGHMLAAVFHALGDGFAIASDLCRQCAGWVEARAEELRARYGPAWASLLWQTVLDAMDAAAARVGWRVS